MDLSEHVKLTPEVAQVLLNVMGTLARKEALNQDKYPYDCVIVSGISMQDTSSRAASVAFAITGDKVQLRLQAYHGTRNQNGIERKAAASGVKMARDTIPGISAHLHVITANDKTIREQSYSSILGLRRFIDCARPIRTDKRRSSPLPESPIRGNAVLYEFIHDLAKPLCKACAGLEPGKTAITHMQTWQWDKEQLEQIAASPSVAPPSTGPGRVA